MSNKKISELDAAAALDGTEQVPVVQSGATKRAGIGEYGPSQTEFDDHAARHQDGGADALNVAGLSGELADPQPPKSHGNTAHDTDLVGEAGVIAAMTAKADPHPDDVLILEDSQDSDAARSVTVADLLDGGEV